MNATFKKIKGMVIPGDVMAIKKKKPAKKPVKKKGTIKKIITKKKITKKKVTKKKVTNKKTTTKRKSITKKTPIKKKIIKTTYKDIKIPMQRDMRTKKECSVDPINFIMSLVIATLVALITYIVMNQYSMGANMAIGSAVVAWAIILIVVYVILGKE